jgi:UDP-glucose 4-epimerase
LQTRAFSYVGDIIPAMVECVEMESARNQVFNVGGDTPYTVKELAEAVLRVSGSKAPLNFLPARQEVLHAFADHAKVRRVFGDQPSVQLEESLRRMWTWAKELGPQEPTRFAGIEVDRNVPAFWKQT